MQYLYTENGFAASLNIPVSLLLQVAKSYTYQPADNLLLEICIKFASCGTFLLENAANLSEMLSPKKMRDLVIFFEEWVPGIFA